jgi:hypothetical protein
MKQFVQKMLSNIMNANGIVDKKKKCQKSIMEFFKS